MTVRSHNPQPPHPAGSYSEHAGRAGALTLAFFLTFVVSHPGVGAVADAHQRVPVGEKETGIAVSVPYVTNRLPIARGSGQTAYGGERGAAGVGRCEVVFTPIPVIHQVAPHLPFYVADATRDVRIERESDAQAFWREVANEVARTASQSVVVFVHGYNYDFLRTCKAAAELQRTLSGKTVVLMFSWPSNGRPADYIPDQADVEWSVPFLARALTELADRLGPKRVQVLAHSLGSRGVVFALERLRAERDDRPLIGQLVLVAPDLDSQTFVERLPVLVPLATGITLYASSNDRPLKVSRQLHASPRLGEAGAFLTVAEGMQTVDVSPVGRYQVSGHGYFRYHPKAVADLAALLGEGRAAPERPGLRPVPFNGLLYWELVGDGAKGDAGDQ